jgi:hypothetical protein
MNIAERDAALANLDMDFARRLMPEASDDLVRLITMHKARYEVVNLPSKLRHESAQWLRDRGLSRFDGTPVLPEGELPV